MDFNCPTLSAELIDLRKNRPEIFSAIYKTLQKTSAINEFIFINKCHEIASSFLNVSAKNLYMHGIMLRMDAPFDNRNIYDWHQDSAYDGVNSVPTNGCILWVPLVDTNEKNGTLIVCPGSQIEPSHIFETKKPSLGVSRQNYDAQSSCS